MCVLCACAKSPELGRFEVLPCLELSPCTVCRRLKRFSYSQLIVLSCTFLGAFCNFVSALPVHHSDVSFKNTRKELVFSSKLLLLLLYSLHIAFLRTIMLCFWEHWCVTSSTARQNAIGTHSFRPLTYI